MTCLACILLGIALMLLFGLALAFFVMRAIPPVEPEDFSQRKSPDANRG